MTKAAFTSEFAEILGLGPGELQQDTHLDKIESWDSVAYLAAMVLIDEKLGITIRPEILARAKTFDDILKAVESALQG